MSLRFFRQTLACSASALLFGAAVLALWQLYVSLTGVSPSFLPSPWRIAQTLLENSELLLSHTLTTLTETVLGFSLALSVALALALTIDLWDAARRAFYPWMVASQTVPIVALAPLMLIWFGFGLLPKVLLVALFCFSPSRSPPSTGSRAPTPSF